MFDSVSDDSVSVGDILFIPNSVAESFGYRAGKNYEIPIVDEEAGDPVADTHKSTIVESEEKANTHD
jgi:hypothetical protein